MMAAPPLGFAARRSGRFGKRLRFLLGLLPSLHTDITLVTADARARRTIDLSAFGQQMPLTS